MKYEILPPAAEQIVVVPHEAIKKAGFESSPILSAYTEENAVVILKEKMTAAELIKSVNTLQNISVELLARLIRAAGICDDYCDCREDCFCCEMEEDCIGLSIPSCVLEDAGISAFSELKVEVEDGAIYIRQAPEKTDLLDTMPQSILDTLVNAGICLKTFRQLVRNGAVLEE